MATQEFYEEEEFIINLTIDGTEYEEVEVKVTGSDLKLSYASKIKKVKVVISKK